MPYNLPHAELRPYQGETIQWLLSLDPGTLAMVEAWTGSGKTAFAAAVASLYKTIAVVEFKQLQDQYVDPYDFYKMTGRSNHDCIHPDNVIPGATCDMCLYGTRMHACPEAHKCIYLIHKRKAQVSDAAILNYAYYSLVGSREGRDGGFLWKKDYLFLDEAHNLSEICLKHYEVKITPSHKERYYLPTFPNIPPMGIPRKLRDNMARDWLWDVDRSLSVTIAAIEEEIKFQRSSGHIDKKEIDKVYTDLSRAERLQMRISAMLMAIDRESEDWYIKSDAEGFLARPVTARYVFPAMFDFDPDARVVLMSATIGNFDLLAQELGIEKYVSRVVPSRYTPEQRPVYVYDAPRMGSTASDAAFEKQADIIANIVKECPLEWSGLVHVTRKTEAWLLRQRLKKRGLGSRVYAALGHNGEYAPTDKQLSAWEQRRDRVPNSILTAWSFHTGFDGREERINIVAKIPFLVFGSPGSYEEAYRQYSMDRYRYVTANRLTQALGRTRRGRDCDYDMDGEKRGMVAIVDGSFGMIKDMLSEEMLESMVRVSA